MNVQILTRHVRQNVVLLVVVLCGIAIFEVLVVSLIAAMDTGAGLQVLITTVLPPAMQDLVLQQFGVASFPSAVAFGFQHPLSLIAALSVIIVFATIPARERESGFLDLVLARPVPRARYLASSLALVVIVACLVPAALLAAAAIGMALVDGAGELPWTNYIPSAVALAPLLLCVGAYTLLFSAQAKRRGLAISWATGLTLFFYWLDFMATFSTLLGSARWLSPFTYYDPVKAAVGVGLELRDPLVLLGAAVILVAVAFRTFDRQEL